MSAGKVALEEEVRKAAAALHAAERALRAFKELTPEQQLAEDLHKLLCHYNHTDMCDWEYGSWTSLRSSRVQYLEQARAARTAATATYKASSDLNEAIMAIVRAAAGRS